MTRAFTNDPCNICADHSKVNSCRTFSCLPRGQQLHFPYSPLSARKKYTFLLRGHGSVLVDT